MTLAHIKGNMLGIIISGGMLIPGNIPNIIAANKLGISSRAWAKVGVPFGMGLMALFFASSIYKFILFVNPPDQ